MIIKRQKHVSGKDPAHPSAQGDGAAHEEVWDQICLMKTYEGFNAHRDRAAHEEVWDHRAFGLSVARMVEMGLPDTEVQSNANILFECARLASKRIQDEGGYSDLLTDETVPYDLKLVRRIMDLVIEGVFLVALLYTQKGLPFEMKPQFMQVLAQDVCRKAKLIVISTIDQDLLPTSDQIPKETQALWVAQEAAIVLLYYINQHEKQFGSIQTAAPPPGAMIQPEFGPSSIGTTPGDGTEDEGLVSAVGVSTGLFEPKVEEALCDYLSQKFGQRLWDYLAQKLGQPQSGGTT